MEQEKYIGSGHTLQKGILNLDGYIPFVNFDSPLYQIKGEVFQVGPKKLQELDRLEMLDMDGGYERDLIDIYLVTDDKDQRISDGKVVKAYIYTNIYHDMRVVREYVDEGDYKKFVMSQSQKKRDNMITDKIYFC
ncbi:UNKNOWN [Stylonychia lemnae]|uniref:Gamma-glutamylcyclotransferase AIG2-like domain-containing protein n=1 Tax=Stylonychia lemnae TaxID=5949 RepID=A0A078BCM7_STYLE|nr:UNKNOWN [Stylonychia lemnae]|eukprot:CDW90962.1 UNKNOWN [Stylonychia lemnae]